MKNIGSGPSFRGLMVLWTQALQNLEKSQLAATLQTTDDDGGTYM